MKFDSELLTKIESYVQQFYSTDKPGAAILVMKNGEVIFRKGYGMANLELEVPIEPHMVFRIGSITKQFTAIAILILYEKGEIDLNNDIHKYLVDYPSTGVKITVENLLTHTSGIPNYTDLPAFLSSVRNDMSPQEIICTFKDLPLEFEPGEKFQYSNSGYILLGSIIEQISDIKYEEFLQKYIFKPLNMTHTGSDISEHVLSGRVAGYAHKDNEYNNATYISMTQPYAAGNLISNVDDLALWTMALYGGKLIGTDTLSKALKTSVLKNGDTTQYGYGCITYKYENVSFVGHTGGVNGFCSGNVYIPSEKTFIAVLCNCGNPVIFPDVIVHNLAAIAIGKPVDKPVLNDIDENELDCYVGSYKIADHVLRVISRQNKQCFSQRGEGPKFKMFPFDKDAFYLKEVTDRFFFVRNEEGNITGMKVVRLFGPAERSIKIDKDCYR